MAISNGLLCDVYLNLHKTGFLSVRAAEGPDRGRVVGHVSAIEIVGCTFRVSEAGRQRVIRERQERPCNGSRQGGDGQYGIQAAGGQDTTYCPYHAPTFIDRETKEPVYAAPSVVIVGKFVAASNGF